ADSTVDWRLGAHLEWRPDAPVGLVYSNAALHWLDGHASLFARLASFVAPGGILAVQMPRNFSEPSHTSIYDTVRAGAWRARLEPLIRTEPTKPGSHYREILLPHVRSLAIWETVYLQVLTGDNPLAECRHRPSPPPFPAALPTH